MMTVWVILAVVAAFLLGIRVERWRQEDERKERDRWGRR